MKTDFKNKFRGLATLLVTLATTTLLLTSCGGSNSELFAISAGQEFRLPIENVEVIGGGISGINTQPGIGAPISGRSITARMAFSNGNNVIGNSITFFFVDILSFQPGITYRTDDINATVLVEIAGQPQFITSAAFILNQIPTAEGQLLSLAFQIDTGNQIFDGRLEDTLRVATF